MWSVFAYTQYTPKDDYTVRLAQDTVVCNTYSSKTIHIIPDSTPIYKGARVKVVFPKYFTEFAWNDMIWIITPPMQRAGYLQARNSRTGLNSFISGVTVSRDEFVNIPSSRFDYRFSHEDNARVVTIVMQDTVRVGDTLQVIYGANGAATNTYNSQVAHSDVFTVLLDNTNSGNYVALESQPTFVFKAAAPRQLNLALASSGKPGKPVLLKVMVNDAYKNQASGFDGYVQLNCSDPGASFPSVIRILPEDNGWKDVYVTFFSTVCIPSVRRYCRPIIPSMEPIPQILFPFQRIACVSFGAIFIHTPNSAAMALAAKDTDTRKMPLASIFMAAPTTRI